MRKDIPQKLYIIHIHSLWQNNTGLCYSNGKGEAYENWARIYNLKQMARTLIYLKGNGIDSYDELVQKSAAASSGFNGKLKRIKEIETRQNEIKSLQYHIGNYGKSREIYKMYIRSGRDDAFFEANRAELTLRIAAKDHFDKLGLKKLPPINSLKQEWATLGSEKKMLYTDYHKMKDQHKNWQIAKDNCERILGIGKDEVGRTADRVQKRSHAHEL